MTKTIRAIQNADPVFLFMVAAVILAVGCSLTLRALVNVGPQSARAGDYAPAPAPLVQGAGGATAK